MIVQVNVVLNRAVYCIVDGRSDCLGLDLPTDTQAIRTAANTIFISQGV